MIFFYSWIAKHQRVSCHKKLGNFYTPINLQSSHNRINELLSSVMRPLLYYVKQFWYENVLIKIMHRLLILPKNLYCYHSNRGLCGRNFYKIYKGFVKLTIDGVILRFKVKTQIYLFPLPYPFHHIPVWLIRKQTRVELDVK